MFNCIIDYLMENVSARVPGIQVGPYHLTDLEYPDDAAIFATNPNNISSALSIFDAEACKLGLRASWAKTKIMKFGDIPYHPYLHICNNDVDFVDKFTYLDFVISNPISTAALDWQPGSYDRPGNHSGATPPSASKPSSVCTRRRYSLSSSTDMSAGQFQPGRVAG